MQAVILAAGESSRFWPLNSRHKSLFKICGKPIIQYTIEGLIKCKIRDIIIVQKKEKDIEKEIGKIEDAKITFVEQEKPLGMGNALLNAKDFLKDNFFVLNADRIDCDIFIKEMISELKNADLILAGSKTQKPWLYGILKMKGKEVISIIEKPNLTGEAIKAVGIYLLPLEFFKYYEKVKKHMYDFEDAINEYIKDHKARAVVKNFDTISLKYPWDLFSFCKILFEKQLKKKYKKISRNVKIEGNVFIGKNTIIYENAVIRGPCYIGDNCVVGNNSILRECTNIENNSVIGANCEIARSIIQENCKIHSGYIGDSIIDRNCKIGAGIITANKRLDEKEIVVKHRGKEICTNFKKLGVIIGENTKIGIRVSTMPGSLIGKNCIIGPNELIRKEVDDGKVILKSIKM
jgi:bifunctional UDP-N-acetylglucosamine pyrophosphorylase/glucosamine-1-phosphate N-acetyltransferase